MNSIKISFFVTNNSEFRDLALECWLDQVKFFDSTVTSGTHRIGHTAELDDGEHVLRIVLKNKTDHHTTIDSAGKIVNDSLINISKININDIEIDQMFWQLSDYVHNNNGKSELDSHRFYGNLGCNGTVSLTFSSPVYLWLLENM